MRSVFSLFKFRVQTPISRTVALYNQSLIWIIIISIFFLSAIICQSVNFENQTGHFFTLKIYVLKRSVKDISFCSRILPIRNPQQAGTFLCYGQRASYNLNVIVPRLLSLPAPRKEERGSRNKFVLVLALCLYWQGLTAVSRVFLSIFFTRTWRPVADLSYLQFCSLKYDQHYLFPLNGFRHFSIELLIVKSIFGMSKSREKAPLFFLYSFAS